MLELNFTLLNIVSLITCFVGVFYVVQIGSLKKSVVKEGKYFTLYLSVISLIVLLFFLVDLNLNNKFLNLTLIFLLVPSIILISPLMWLYIRKLISYKQKSKSIVHLLPAILSATLIALFFGLYHLTKNDVFIDLVKYVCIVSLAGVFIFQNIYYIYHTIKGYKLFKKNVEQVYSYSEEVDLSWIKVLVVGYVVFILGITVVNVYETSKPLKIEAFGSYKGHLMLTVAKNEKLKNNERVELIGLKEFESDNSFLVKKISKSTFYLPKVNSDSIQNKHFIVQAKDKFKSDVSNIIFNLIVLIYIIYTGHYALKQKSILISELIESNEPFEEIDLKDKNISETQLIVFQKIKNDLLEVMKTEKPYLDQNLNIFTLAKRLGTNSKYLSQVINQEFDKSFVHFINEYRIEEAKQILLVENNYTIEAQSQMVGFKSKSSFNIAFKRHTGITPTLFIQGNKYSA